MKVVGYRRLSPSGSSTTEELEEKLEKQKKRIESYCEENDHELIGIFTDERVSGRKQDPIERNGFNELLDVVTEHGNIGEIVAFSGDRFTRNIDIGVAIHTYVNAILTERGYDGEVRFYTVLEDEYLDPVDGVGDAVERMLLFMKSQMEAEHTANKTQDALDEKVVKGRPPRGLTTDKRLAAEHEIDLGEASRWLPDENTSKEKCFNVSLAVCHAVDDGEESKTDIGREYGFAEGSEWDIVEAIWKNRHKYALAVLWHREVQSMDVPWYANERTYEPNWAWLDDELLSPGQQTVTDTLEQFK